MAELEVGLNGGKYTGSAYNGYYNSGGGATQTAGGVNTEGWIANAATFGKGGTPGTGCTSGSGRRRRMVWWS